MHRTDRIAFVVLVLVQLSVDATEPDTAARIYRCQSDAGLVFSDRPCATSAAVITLDERRLNTYAPVPVPAQQARAQRRSRAPRAATATAGRPEPACATLRKRIDRIDARMRQGYSAQAGERLRERRRTAVLALAGCR